MFPLQRKYSNQCPNGNVAITSISMGPIAMRSATEEKLETQLAIRQILTSTQIEPLKDTAYDALQVAASQLPKNTCPFLMPHSL